MPEKKNEPLTAEVKLGINEVELKTVEVRLNSVREATHRSRFIFLVMIVMCAATLLGIWNITFSFDKQKAFSPRVTEDSIRITEEDIEDFVAAEKDKRIENLRRKNTTLSDKELAEMARNELTDAAPYEIKSQRYRLSSNRDEVIGEWIKNRIISIGLLGIRIDATDLSVVGSLSLMVGMAWFFFCVRRENRAIVTLLRDIYKDWKTNVVGLDVCRMVYYGVVNSLVFIDMRGGDSPIGGLERELKGGLAQNENRPEQGDEGNTHRDNEDDVHNAEKKKVPFVRRIISILTFLPPLTIFVIVASDIYSLFIRSPYRDFQKSLATFFWESPDAGEIYMKIIAFDGTAFVACLYTAYICWRCRQFSKETARTIIEFRKETQLE